MCFGSSPKVKMPKAPELPDPVQAPVMPQAPKAAPKPLQQMGATPDIRIGSQKSNSTSRNRNSSSLKSSLSIGKSGGLNI